MARGVRSNCPHKFWTVGKLSKNISPKNVNFRAKLSVMGKLKGKIKILSTRYICCLRFLASCRKIATLYFAYFLVNPPRR